MIPYPMPGGDGGAGAEGSAEGDPGSGDGPGGQMASGSGPDPGSAGEPLERDLGGGGDEWGGTVSCDGGAQLLLRDEGVASCWAGRIDLTVCLPYFTAASGNVPQHLSCQDRKHLDV